MQKNGKIFKINHLFLLCTIGIIFMGCKNSEKKKQDEVDYQNAKEEAVVIPEKVTLIGNSASPRPLRNMAFVDYSYFYGGNHEDTSKEVLNSDKGSMNITLGAIEQPQIVEVFAIGDDNLYNTRLFVTPGDSLSFEAKNGKFVFSGQNSPHYNFFTELDSTSNEWAENGFQGNIDEYKRAISKIHERRKKTLKNYLKQYPSLSQEFITQVRAELEFEYLYNLMHPRSIKSDIPNVYLNDMNGIISTISNQNNTNEDVINLRTYFDNIDIEEFNRPDLINNDYFKRSLISFIRYYFVPTQYLNYTEENFNAELKYIKENLDKDLKDFAIGKVIEDYYNKGFGQGQQDKEVLESEIARYKERSLKPSYVKAITKIEQDLNLNNIKLPAVTMNEKLIDLNGDTLTLGDVFDMTEHKIKAINFWGPLCTPCETDIRKSKVFKERMSTEENMEFIYISVIENEKAREWKKRSEALKNYLNTEHQYKMLDVKSSVLLDFLKVSNNKSVMIPKFSIIDAQERILQNNAPKPSDSLAFTRSLKGI